MPVPRGLLGEGDERQSAHVRATERTVRSLKREVRDAFANLLRGRITRAKVDRVVLLHERLEGIMRRDLSASASTSYRGWSRTITKATGIRRKVTEPGAVEVERVVMQPLAGERWTQRLERHSPTVADLMNVFGGRRPRADVLRDLEAMAGRVSARVGALARTEAHRVNQAMSERAAKDLLGAQEIVGWRYMTMDDERVRPEHRLLHGRIYQSGTPRPTIPNGVQCRCFYLPVTAPGAVARAKARAVTPPAVRRLVGVGATSVLIDAART